MDTKSFKNSVLDSLNLKIEPDPNKFKGINKSNFRDNISKTINNEIVERVKNADPKKRKEMVNALENSIKTFSLDDILKRVQGMEVSKAFYKANNEDYIKRANENKEEYSDKLQGFKKQKINSFVDAYLCLGDKYDFFGYKNTKVGEIYFVFKEHQVKNGPETLMEDAIVKFFGGTKNIGKTDALRDLTAGGIDISVKCLKEGTSAKFGSIDSVRNANYKIFYKIYRYEDIVINQNNQNNKYIKTWYDKKSSFCLYKGKKYSNIEDALKDKNDYNNSKNDLSINGEKTQIVNNKRNDEIFIEILNKIKEINNELGTDININELKKEISINKIRPDTFVKKINKTIKNKISNNENSLEKYEKYLKELEEISKSYITKNSIKTKYFNY